MTNQTPIERAAPALFEAIIGADEIVPTEVRMAMLTRADRDTFREGSRAVFESIDTDRLATVILRSELPGGLKVGHADKIALAVKNYLTGGTQ